ncbi:fungal-specific transcription factor domain-domain-containing protein [Protomyces lactucae-debilis]|uniref:Fungal-specific transcription factor domain-domain-containing protein n=1 Tax=Protomyces lactucae-debilis TaxID=2754530 RepID=A0A1Y2F9N6_PROLT|nr:fungal-specific transcription factor domain-containing protein [Protomyces lactucae-debilis]ORY80347.1 fungal-specific transcription factor domain-domain-containing protein [Protomyces lactucae-debilis]
MANNVERSSQQPARQSPDMRRADHAAQAPIQFVFIDESSRDSKRSKITRACISCRRRKIKCVWGGEICTSCQRLGTECVVQAQEGVTEVSPYTSNTRRTSGDDGEFDGSNKRAQERRLSVSTPTNSTADTQHSVSPPSSYIVPARTAAARRPAQGNRRASHKTSQGTLAMASKTPLTDSMPGVNTLTDIFGGLHIHQGGIAGYINDDAATSMNDDFYTKRMASDMFPVISEWPVTHDEIASLLPPTDLAFDLLNIFFDDLHPYLPVVNRQLFFQDYVSDRTVISPYLLLSIFALAARFSEDPRVRSLPDEPTTRGDIWWDLIQRYKDDFRDSPRLSTVQADVLNLKNLESRPETKGYWYRAWFNLSCTLRMCKDLGLHHVNRPMVTDPDAVAGRRVWQVCFIYDQMMASSQGREMQLDMSLVDLTLLPSLQLMEHDFTEEEVNLHNNFVFMVGLLKILRRGTVVFRTVGIKFPFAADASYPAISDVLEQWHKNLPDRLRYCPFKDERLSSHFVGQLHLTYCLITCLLHRPWLVSVGAYGASGEWRTHLRKCNEAARAITATYEALFRQYGSRSVQLMLRGNYFAMYVCVVATMIHAVSLTCPEQEFSEGASDFFSRSLSILDRLAVILSTPMMRKQYHQSLPHYRNNIARFSSNRANKLCMPTQRSSRRVRCIVLQRRCLKISSTTHLCPQAHSTKIHWSHMVMQASCSIMLLKIPMPGRIQVCCRCSMDPSLTQAHLQAHQHRYILMDRRR